MNPRCTQDLERRTRERRLQRELEDPPILYLRTGILVRDPARAAAETTEEGREWSGMLSSIGLAVLIGSILGLVLR